MKPSEIRELSIPELEKKLRDTSDELLGLRVRKQVGQLERPSEIMMLRRDIARMNTILKERVSAEN